MGRLARRHSTATVLFHHAVAERLGLGPTDHKVLDLLRERGTMTGSEIAAVTGLTTGAITGVVARLERAGFLRREPDLRDGRKQNLTVSTDRAQHVHGLLAPMRNEVASLLVRFDLRQLDAIAEFLKGSAELAYRQVAVLRAESLGGGERAGE